MRSFKYGLQPVWWLMGLASCRHSVTDSMTPLIMNIQLLFLVCLFMYVIASEMFVEHLQRPAAMAPGPQSTLPRRRTRVPLLGCCHFSEGKLIRHCFQSGPQEELHWLSGDVHYECSERLCSSGFQKLLRQLLCEQGLRASSHRCRGLSFSLLET